MKKVAVYCGSNFGADKIFKIQANLLGKALAKEKIELIYGGAEIGLMGALANGALEENGKVIGILPKFLKSKESAHEMLSELILVDTMHERKSMMNELCDGIIALPGGIGTLEELIEMLTWRQIGLHQKPIGILNINGFYESLISLFQTMVDNGFMKKENLNKIIISDDIDDLLHLMENYNE
ncbi:TIGR00730 family Rossman fold protein [uncultured Psychroserpens sp.]|uniref:LOG family protein n=1 Tax=uncultured Psychroserpens sp. TaxID=255436 RepID=UPI0026049F69|nr:TIGR00730 family Rossman fold protein [uncultured Psychroserpens sp.]